MNTLALLVLASVSGATPAEEIADRIVAAKHKKVGVIPSVISRLGAREATVGSLGPRARTIPKVVHNQLVTLSSDPRYRGKFSVVSERVMRNAIKEVARSRSLNVDDLGNPRALKAMSNYTGADGFVTLTFDEDPKVVDADADGDDKESSESPDDDEKDDSSDSKVSKRDNFEEFGIEGIDAEGDQFISDKVKDRNILSTAAYMGDSFEVLRWNGNTLSPVGLQSNHPMFSDKSNWQYGKGEKWEQVKFQRLKSTLEHPFEIDGFPYELQAVVDGEVRPRRRLDDKYVVQLEPGEEYEIELKNDTEHQALVALFIDGVNSIDMELREPLELESHRHWVLKPGVTGKVRGWYNIDAEQKQQKGNRFRIVERDQSVAAQKGFFDNIGTITAIFYVNDAVSAKHVNYPDDKLLENLRGALPDSLFGTGTGAKVESELKFREAKRGAMLAAVTVYYRSQQEIDDIENSGGNDLVFADPLDLADNRDQDRLDWDPNPNKNDPQDDDEPSSDDEPKKEDQAKKDRPGIDRPLVIE